jgi:type III secretion system YscD/HrpQ family protein
MAAKLVAEEGGLKGLVLSLEDGDSWLIGRDPAVCQLVIEDSLVSRKHAIAYRDPHGFLIENLSSTNPIQINEEAIQEGSRLLQQGDTLRIGNEVFRFYSDTEAHVLDQELLDEIQKQSPGSSHSTHEEEPHDTIFDEENIPPLAEINFDISETGRWLLKVIGGPNTGAEFYMQTGNQYVLGTDPHSCDIVFHDTSVSRQHARITVTNEDSLVIEDLRSRNGILINSQRVEDRQIFSPSTIVTMGTTSFVVYDREGEMHTIISPLLPSIVKVLRHEESSKEETPSPSTTPTPPPAAEPSKPPRNYTPLILLFFLISLFSLVGLGISSLFTSQPIVVEKEENTSELLKQALSPFPAVKYSFNPSTGRLLLLGHALTQADKNQLIYSLEGLRFIKSIDDSGLVIDEYVWQEINSVLGNNPAWRGISIHSPAAGQFILTGYLQTRAQAEQLSDYMSINFPYLDLLKKEIVVEEDVVNLINLWLQQMNLRTITLKMNSGEVILNGQVSSDKTNEMNELIQRIKEIPGVRIVNNLVRSEATESGLINISDQYEITGSSRTGTSKYTVVINGRILSEGDVIDGMVITSIKPNIVLLEREGTTFRIDYK